MSPSSAVPLLSVFGLIAGLAAQAGIEYVEQPWPTTGIYAPDQFRKCTVGRLVLNHPGRHAAVVRDNKIFLSQDPGYLRAFRDVTPSGLTISDAVALPTATPGGTDRLITISGSGLRVAWDTGGDTFSAGAALSAWSTLRALRARPFTEGGARHHLIGGYADSNNNKRVRVALVDDAGGTPVETFTYVADTPVLDVALVEWGVVAGETEAEPEVAVLSTAGLKVWRRDGTLVHTIAQAVLQGHLAAIDDPTQGGALEVLVAAARVATPWQLFVLAPWGVLEQGTFPFGSTVRGLAVGHLDSNGFPDLIVSTAGCKRWFVTSNGSNGSFDAGTALSCDDIANSPANPPEVNSCPALLDDVDLDGHLDAVIFTRVSGVDYVVVLPRVLNTVRILNQQLPVLLAPAPFSVVHYSNGQYWYAMDPPVAPATTYGTKIKLWVPAGAAADHNHVTLVVWALTDTGDVWNATPESHLFWSAPAGGSAGEVTISFPFLEQTTPNTNAQYLLFEFRRVKLNSSNQVVAAGTASVFSAGARRASGMTWGEMVNKLKEDLWDGTSQPGWFMTKATNSSDGTWHWTVQGEPDCREFVGVHVSGRPKRVVKQQGAVPPPTAGTN